MLSSVPEVTMPAYRNGILHPLDGKHIRHNLHPVLYLLANQIILAVNIYLLEMPTDTNSLKWHANYRHLRRRPHFNRWWRSLINPHSTWPKVTYFSKKHDHPVIINYYSLLASSLLKLKIRVTRKSFNAEFQLYFNICHFNAIMSKTRNNRIKKRTYSKFHLFCRYYVHLSGIYVQFEAYFYTGILFNILNLIAMLPLIGKACGYEI